MLTKQSGLHDAVSSKTRCKVEVKIAVAQLSILRYRMASLTQGLLWLLIH
jgi:hypothetical protein